MNKQKISTENKPGTVIGTASSFKRERKLRLSIAKKIFKLQMKFDGTQDVEECKKIDYKLVFLNAMCGNPQEGECEPHPYTAEGKFLLSVIRQYYPS